MIVTAVVVPSNYSVRLTATAYTGTVSWFRVEARDVPLGTGPVIEDRAAPLNQPITYYAKDSGSTVVAAPVTVTASGPILSDTTSNAARLVNVISYRPYRGQGRSVWHPVIGRSDPFVSVFPALYPGGTLRVLCRTNDERVALILDLLEPGAPLLLRSTCPERLDTMTFLMLSWSDPFPSDEMREGPTYLEVEFQRVTDVSPAWAPPARTYQDVIDQNATYAVVLTKYPTYQALLDGTSSITVPAAYLSAANVTHAPLWRVRMLTAAGVQIGDPLPFTDGTVEKSNAVTPRCRATVTVPTSLVPSLIDQNYIPTGQRLVFEYSIQNLGTWVTVADLDMVSSEITRPDSMWRLEAADRSIRVARDDTARGAWVEPTGTISDAIQYIVNRTFPGSTFQVTGTALTQTVPVGVVTDGDPWNAAVGLATAAQSEAFHRAHDRVWVVRHVPAMEPAAAGPPVDAISVGDGGQVTQYTLTHEMGYNMVALRYRAKDGGAILRTGTWLDSRTTSPVAVQRIGSRVVYRETRDVDAAPTQAEANNAASALGARVAGRSRSPSIRHVARPWLEPGDTIAVTYSGGPTELQLIDSISIPLDNTNIQTTVARSSNYQMGVPV